MSTYLIIGGVAGGATCAARLRRLDEKATIILFEKGEYISYANCGLPYYIGDVIKDRKKLFLQTPKSFKQRYNIDVRVNAEVISIDKLKKTIEVLDLKTNQTYQEKYDKLILSPGAIPIKPSLPGIDHQKIFTLRNVQDTDQIKNFITNHHPANAVIIGGGFIGLEMVENLHNLGIKVSIVEMVSQVMNVIDYEMAMIVQKHLQEKQTDLYLNDAASSFESKGQALIVKLKSGKELITDFVILSIGVKADHQLAQNAGLSIGTTGGILVNDYLQTSDPDIYALGDAIEFNNPLLNKKVFIPLAGPANKQGRITADNIVFNNRIKYKGSIATAIARVFDLTVACTGLSEKTLKQEKIPYFASITQTGSHAGYYPNAVTLTIKILFSPDQGKLLGAQIIGSHGVDKRIDLFASIINQNGTIYDLETLEHAYAPPYSSAKDPVNIAGFVAENILNGLVKVIRYDELIPLINKSDVYILDVRTDGEYSIGSIPGVKHIPIDELRSRMNELPTDKKMIVHCASGLRSYIACRILSQAGFNNVYNLTGGYNIFSLVGLAPNLK